MRRVANVLEERDEEVTIKVGFEIPIIWGDKL